jgi:glycosyltransferase involved in cell wall biosynthesis
VFAPDRSTTRRDEMAAKANASLPAKRDRPLIAFFDYPDVFEDFYPHYGVDQRSFATEWMDTAVHGWLALVQREIGDVIWYVFSLAPELSEARHERVGCRVKFLSSSWLHRCLWRAFYLPKAAWRWRRAYRAYAMVASYLALASWPFLQTLRRDRPDVFFVASYSSGRFDMLILIARLLKVPLLVLHTGGTPTGYLGRFAKRWTIPRSNWIFSSGHSELEMLVDRYRVPRERVDVIRPTVDTIVFRPLDRNVACEAAGLDPARRYVLFVGRLDDSVKRVSAIISAFAQAAPDHPDADLVIVGEGRDGLSLRAFAAKQANGRIHFFGWISGPEAKAQIYSAAECLILASLREASPAVINEAFACGTPVLSSRVGGISDLVVDGQTGWLYPPGDDGALAAGLSHVLSRPELVASLRAKVRKVADDLLSPATIAATLRRGFSSVGGTRG